MGFKGSRLKGEDVWDDRGSQIRRAGLGTKYQVLARDRGCFRAAACQWVWESLQRVEEGLRSTVLLTRCTNCSSMSDSQV